MFELMALNSTVPTAEIIAAFQEGTGEMRTLINSIGGMALGLFILMLLWERGSSVFRKVSK